MKPNILLEENFVINHLQLFEELESSVVWDERMKARKTASFGVSYDYSGVSYRQTSMLKSLDLICECIEKKLGFKPNNCLMNYYMDGNSSMGFHSDSAEELLEGAGVAIISLGAERNIWYRSKLDKEVKIPYLLKSGALLYMGSELQQHWTHAILKEKNVGSRISLTFRHIIK